MSSSKFLSVLLEDVRACTICKDLPLGPRPILQGSTQSKILIAGQAPGRITHEKGLPFDDPSGVRLRRWMGITEDAFYDPDNVAILPMGFCFPGTGKSGDLPPRPECAKAWRNPLLGHLNNVELTLIIGQYAINWHINDGEKVTLTERVSRWKTYMPSRLVMPHPSPRNNRWLKRNPWFEAEVVLELQKSVTKLLS
ncbi:MAG: uracil-DNA glycosylase family protein [Hellea sp.]